MGHFSFDIVIISYIISACIGISVGLTELLSRYKDAPWAASTSMAGLIYLAFNGFVSFVTLYLIRVVFPISEMVAGNPPSDIKTLATHCLLAGFGSMALLRSSIFTIQIGGKDVPIGLAAVIDIFRNTMDRDVARVRVGPRAQQVRDIMSDVSFVRAYEALSSISFALLQNVSAEEQASLRQQIDALANQTGRSDQDKALELGLILADAVGFPALNTAKDTLGDRITSSTNRTQIVSETLSGMTDNQILQDLPSVCIALSSYVPDKDQAALSEQISLLAESNLSKPAILVNAGLVLISIVGEDTFKAAAEILKLSDYNRNSGEMQTRLLAEADVP